MIYENLTYEQERALYGESGLILRHCAFDGEADGESALKEARNITAEHCFFNLRYPLWHNRELTLTDCEMTDKCRAPLWYSENIRITGTRIYGVKALRECNDVIITDCDIVSPEFGWSVSQVRMTDCKAQSEYFMLRSSNISFDRVTFSGKYSFQYIENSEFTDCVFDTKDALWHAKNVTVRDSVINGEYLGWYSENLTFINCKIKGTQPLCYCKELRLIDCEMTEADLSFEKSQVTAELTAPVISVKNPLSGRIYAPEIGEIIRDNESYDCIIVTGKKPDRQVV